MTEYLHLTPLIPLPEIQCLRPFKAVVLVEMPVESDWQWQVSQWLVASGCLYMMAWGLECSSWDDTVDWANLEMFNYGDIPDNAFVMTTWHEKENLKDLLWFAKYTIQHPDVSLENMLLLHIAQFNQEKILEMYNTL
jgi:hypothetical protein